MAKSLTTRKRHCCAFPPLGAHCPASRMRLMSASGTGSGLRRRIARVVWMISKSSVSSAMEYLCSRYPRREREPDDSIFAALRDFFLVDRAGLVNLHDAVEARDAAAWQLAGLA